MNKKEVSLICSIIINVVIVILEIIALIIHYGSIGNGIAIQYYTIDSNVLALVSSLLFVIYLFFDKKIPKWLKIFKYITTVSLTITLFVVLLILLPMSNFNYSGLLFSNVMLCHHLLCPILGIITFIFFDDIGDFTTKDSILSLGLTYIYSAITITLNLTGDLIGPYPFLMILDNSILESIFYFVIIYGLSYLISFTLRTLRYKIKKGEKNGKKSKNRKN